MSFPPWHGRNCPHHLPVVAVAPAQRWLEEPGVLFFSAGAARARMAALASTAATENPPPPDYRLRSSDRGANSTPRRAAASIFPCACNCSKIAPSDASCSTLSSVITISATACPMARSLAILFVPHNHPILCSPVYQCRLENGPSYQVQPLCCKPSWMKAAITAAVIAPPTGCRSF